MSGRISKLTPVNLTAERKKRIAPNGFNDLESISTQQGIREIPKNIKLGTTTTKKPHKVH